MDYLRNGKKKARQSQLPKLELGRRREDQHETGFENNSEGEGPSLGRHGNTALSEEHGGSWPGVQTRGSDWFKSLSSRYVNESGLLRSSISPSVKGMNHTIPLESSDECNATLLSVINRWASFLKNFSFNAS